MKDLIIEIGGVRHRLVPNQSTKVDYCTKEGCSLYGYCQKAPVATCNVAVLSGYHFERWERAQI